MTVLLDVVAVLVLLQGGLVLGCAAAVSSLRQDPQVLADWRVGHWKQWLAYALALTAAAWLVVPR